MSIPGLPAEVYALVLAELQCEPELRRVELYGSRALGRHRSGSDMYLCLDAPAMTLEQLLEAGARLDDLLLPLRFDLLLDNLITHAGMRDHIQRAGVCLWERQA